MYLQIIMQMTQQLKGVEGWLDKAEVFANAQGRDVQELLDGRLASDMGGFIYQVQSACDYVKGGAAWLSGQKPPKHEDNERAIDEVCQRIRKTVAFVESVPKNRYADAGVQKVVVSWGPAGTVVAGEDYLLQVVVPNAYFHLSMAYAVFRHYGVEVGKMDFLSRINWIKA